MATLEGSIQPPPPAWDPYAPPVASPPSLLPQDPYLTSPTFPGFSADATVATMKKFLQELRLDYHWFAGTGQDELGINDVELTATFAIPFLYNAQTPLLVTPGFGIHLWDGPESPEADMPPRTYDAFLDVAWRPQVTQWLGGDLGVRVGVYSDFKKWDDHNLRVMGRGIAVLSFSPAIQVRAGAMYLDRVRVKILPAGGLVWTPSPDTRFDILFPNPKIARRLTTVGNTEWWGYARGEYGGGSWAIQRELMLPGEIDRVDYNDLRFAMGVEFMRSQGLHGLFEVGFAFERELVYASRQPQAFHPNPTVFLHGSIAF